MAKVYFVFGTGIILLGLLHLAAAVRGFEALTSEAIWFFSGGIAIVLTGALNLLNRAYGRIAPGLRFVCIGTNACMTVFSAAAGKATGASLVEYLVVLGLVGGATALSLTRGVTIVKASELRGI